MKKLTVTLFGLFLLLLAACSSDTLTIEIEKDVYYQKDNPSAFAIKVTDENGPVKDLEINAILTMLNMDHGKSEVTFKELGEGIYSTDVELPMSGEWEIVFNLKQDGKEFEKVLEYEVQETSGVATINGDWITEEDLEFYRFINELHIAISREKDKSKYEGEELQSALAYWDGQEKLIQDQNQLLTQIIRLRSMALLGEEKGYIATNEEVQKEIAHIRKQYEEYDVAQNMIKEYGEEQFWDKEQKQYELIVLSQKVQNDLIAQVRKENPDVNEQEILYLAQKQYEELLVSQVNSLKIEIM
jgi:hypothetical protein